jgi:hypothetical protein
MKKMKVLERSTASKPAKKSKAVSPTVLMNGKRTAEQLETESKFAKAISSGAYDAMVAQVRKWKSAGQLVDCSI